MTSASAHRWEAVKRTDMPGVGPGVRIRSALCERCGYMRFTTVLLDAPQAAELVHYIHVHSGPLPKDAPEPECV